MCLKNVILGCIVLAISTACGEFTTSIVTDTDRSLVAAGDAKPILSEADRHFVAAMLRADLRSWEEREDAYRSRGLDPAERRARLERSLMMLTSHCDDPSLCDGEGEEGEGSEEARFEHWHMHIHSGTEGSVYSLLNQQVSSIRHNVTIHWDGVGGWYVPGASANNTTSLASVHGWECAGSHLDARSSHRASQWPRTISEWDHDYLDDAGCEGEGH